MQALLLQSQSKVAGSWESFDGQAYIIDDLLQAQGLKKGDLALVSIDGGAETYRRIADPASLLSATVATPFEALGKAAVDSMQAIAADGKPKGDVTTEPHPMMNA